MLMIKKFVFYSFENIYWVVSFFREREEDGEDDAILDIQKQPSRDVIKKVVLKICSKFTGEHTYRSVISIKLLCKFIEITLRHGCSPVNLMYIFRTTFLRIPMDGCFWKVEKRSKHQMQREKQVVLLNQK